jgi:glycosyltransferase involved in cell wall biosynthesis
MSRRVLRLLFIPREPYPTDRVRINVLFGRELLGRGHEIDLLMGAADERVPTGPQPWFGRTVWVGPTDARDSLIGRLRKHWLALRHDLRSLRLARRSRYDAVLVSDGFVLGAILALVLPARGVKFIFWLTFPIPELDLASAADGTARYPLLVKGRGLISAALLYRWILRRADHVFVQSERMKQDIVGHGIDPAKMSPILTGFGVEDVRPRGLEKLARARSEPRRAGLVLAYLGTLSSERHLEMLVDMLALLRGRGVQAKLLFIGYADRARDQESIEKRAAELGVAEHMQITGFLPQAVALERVLSADICLSPIHRSPLLDVGSPTKLIEYLALGMPVVANDHPEQREILHESRAGVCVPWGARHFARAVMWLMRRQPEELHAMAVRGREWVERNRTYARIADAVESTCLAVTAGDKVPERFSAGMR